MSDKMINDEVTEEQSTTSADGLTTITAKTTIDDSKTVASASFVFDFKGTLEAAAEAFTAETVYNMYVRAATIDAQAVIRGLLKSGKSAAEIKDYMESEWFPGASRDNSEAAALARFMKLSEEEQLSFLQKLQSMM